MTSWLTGRPVCAASANESNGSTVVLCQLTKMSQTKETWDTRLSGPPLKAVRGRQPRSRPDLRESCSFHLAGNSVPRNSRFVALHLGALPVCCSSSARHSVTIPCMSNLRVVLAQLRQEHNRLTSQLERLTSAIATLNGTDRNTSRRKLSAAGRARIAAAQKARWAKAKGEKVVSIASRGRRKISAAALANIRAAQKARWAKWRKAKKTA
jgi:hypothetical protein